MGMSVTELNLACCAVEAAEGVELWRSSERGQVALMQQARTSTCWSSQAP